MTCGVLLAALQQITGGYRSPARVMAGGAPARHPEYTEDTSFLLLTILVSYTTNLIFLGTKSAIPQTVVPIRDTLLFFLSFLSSSLFLSLSSFPSGWTLPMCNKIQVSCLKAASTEIFVSETSHFSCN
ncbi:hypothetical protein Y032_0183g920 [Ancylostoma ceylanicum]|uniref:Uncharacterized protein n=1 Tax=Ancylostoma ceylanicum TaxID=53326 RepID=A0A016SSE8_9BILA|nr:hypothetical protein Y032_0183g920 [Ancylostoma ceylanicum]